MNWQADAGILWMASRNVGLTGALYYRWQQFESEFTLPTLPLETGTNIVREAGFLAGVSVFLY